jgi:serpin B
MKFSTPTYDMKTYFEAMGLQLPFSDNANFSLIGSQPIKIDTIKHKAFIEIDEKGTEASAVTVILEANATDANISESIPKKMHINRDFIFFIKNNQTSQILFMGLIKEIV